MLLNGIAAPTAADGVDGDFWIQTGAWLIFGPKAAGAWPAGVEMIGHTPTTAELDALIAPRVAAATQGLQSQIDALAAAVDRLQSPVITTGRFLLGVTRINQNSGSLVVAATATPFKKSLIAYGLPSYRTNGVKGHFSGFASTEGGNSPQETMLPGNDTTIHRVRVMECVLSGGALTPIQTANATFAGSATTTIANAALGAWWDEVTFPNNLRADSILAVETIYSTAVGQNQIPNARIQKHRGERIWGATTLAALIDQTDLSAPSTPSLDTSYGAQAQPQFYAPDMIVQRGGDGRAVTLAVIDSIGDGRQDYSVGADLRGNRGGLSLFLDAPDPVYGRKPHYKMGMPGSASLRELNTSATKRWDVLDQVATFNGGARAFDLILDQLGQNDLQTIYSTMRGNYKALITPRLSARYPGVKVGAMGVLPRTSSPTTDNYRTRASQTPVTGNAYPGGNKWLLETDKAALLDGTLSFYISTDAYWYDAAYPGTWPNAQMTTLAAPAGVDGTTPYDQITVTVAPMRGDLIRWDSDATTLGLAVEVSGTGPWLVKLDRTATRVAPAGTSIFYPDTADGVHLYASAQRRLAAAIPQSEKAKFTA